MREIWARRIAFITGVLIFFLSVYFARIQNPVTTPEVAEQKPNQSITHTKQIDPETMKLGQNIYHQNNCSLCHAIKGQGNPRYPLDGVGSRMSAKELRQWIVGDEEIKGQLSERSFKFKQIHRQINDIDLQLLISYLQSL